MFNFLLDHGQTDLLKLIHIISVEELSTESHNSVIRGKSVFSPKQLIQAITFYAHLLL